MRNLPLIYRRRDTSTGLVVPTETRRPFRFWMTGSLAVVMAAMVPLRGATEAERSQAMRWLRHSRFDVAETLERLEIAARDRGLPVLARLAGSRPVLVLGSSVGGTLVVMRRADSLPAVPLSLMVSASTDGGADVLAGLPTESCAVAEWSGLPAAVADDLQGLPGMVERALRA